MAVDEAGAGNVERNIAPLILTPSLDNVYKQPRIITIPFAVRKSLDSNRKSTVEEGIQAIVLGVGNISIYIVSEKRCEAVVVLIRHCLM